MFALRLRSFNALEQELRLARRWERFVGNQKPSADTIGRVLSRFSLDQLRSFLLTINRTSWRNKAIHPRVGESYRVVAVDGHEMWASRARCCNRCLIREVKAGEKKVKEYYHRIVVAQWAGVTPPAILDLEGQPERGRSGGRSSIDETGVGQLLASCRRNHCRRALS